MMASFSVFSVLALCSFSSCLGEMWEVSGSTEFSQGAKVFEGLCTDGENFLVNTKYEVSVMNTDLEVLHTTINAIPRELMAEGYNHLGDCSCDEVSKTVYYAVEEPEKVKPSIFVYNLTLNGVEFLKQKAQPNQSHMPWVALDANSGLLFSSEYDNVDKLFAYDSNSLEFLFTISLSGRDIPLNGVQGGEFYKGELYLGTNTGDTVYVISTSTGSVKRVLQQTEKGSPEEYEYEGLTFLDLRKEGRGLMHNTGNHMHPNAMVHAVPSP